MVTQKEIQILAESLKKNGLAASDPDAVKMARRMLGAEESAEPEVAEPETEATPEVEEKLEANGKIDDIENTERAVKLEDIEPVEKSEQYNINKENRTVLEVSEKGEELEKSKILEKEQEKKPKLSEKEKSEADLTKWFYYGKK